jgi:hypothetical protein
MKYTLTILLFLISFAAIAQTDSNEPIEVSIEACLPWQDVQKANERVRVSDQLSFLRFSFVVLRRGSKRFGR